ncbi:MAG: ImmA/IrrE family metallo-endopeptidase [Pseudomonadota bacterium]
MDARTRQRIENEAFELHKKIWRNLPDPKPKSVEELIGALDPVHAASLLGMKLAYLPELSVPYRKGNGMKKLGGIIDRQRNLIAVATNVKPSTALFTAAHELGHIVLHDDIVMHRDVPIEGGSSSNDGDPKEQEASFFAACFLMPRNLTRKAFERCFNSSIPLVIDDNAAFYLSSHDPDALLRAEHGSLARELAVATAERFGGTHFNSLATQFGVSVTAMAIRLRELGLVKAWP